MSFKLSQRSLGRLDGVKNEMHSVVVSAIDMSNVDFGVICGLRTQEEQEDLLAQGATQTLKSKHLTGDAVDLMAYIGSRASWELNLYDDIADAMKQAAIKHDVAIKWGAAWSVGNIAEWEGTMEEAMNSYIDLRRSEGRRPFIDGPHFELM
tara:strand:+ start:254 stop:706 length:453 start_codon:yes stop_codon:yes gene_type:complete